MKRYPVTIWVRLFGELLTRLTSNMIAPFLVLYLHEKIGGSVLLTMLVIGLQPLTDIVLTLLVGGLADRLGRKPVILFSLGFQALAMLGMAFAGTMWMFALLYMLNGAGRSFYIPAARAQIADAVPDGQRTEVFALLNTVSSIGTTAGPLLGLLVYALNPALSFALVALSITLYLLAVWFKVPESAPPASSSKEKKITSPLLANLSSYKTVLTLMVFTLPISLFYSQAETNFRLQVQVQFVNDLSVLAWLATAHGILSLVLQMWIIKRTERISACKLIVAAYLCYAVVAYCYGNSSLFAVLLLCQAVLTVAECIGLTHMLTIVSSIAPEDQRSRYFSLHGIHWDISRTLGPYAGGLVFVHFGGATLFTIIAILLLIGALAQYSLIKRIEHENSSKGYFSKVTSSS